MGWEKADPELMPSGKIGVRVTYRDADGFNWSETPEFEPGSRPTPTEIRDAMKAEQTDDEGKKYTLEEKCLAEVARARARASAGSSRDLQRYTKTEMRDGKPVEVPDRGLSEMNQ